MTSHPVAWLSHPACALHDMGPMHPEAPSRLATIEDRLRMSGVRDFLRDVEAPRATREQLLRVHGERHVDSILAGAKPGAPRAIDGDTTLMEHTAEAALRAAGAAAAGVDLVLDGEAELAFCATRPPGHHCERDRAMGFCFFNNVAVGAAQALSRGLRRIAILDFDLHYGNGTADIFLRDERVVLYSTYQHPLYPGWSGAPHARHLLDVPLPAHAGSEAFRSAVDAYWMPRLDEQRPEIVLVSAGFDAHAQDPLGDLRLTFEDYAWVAGRIRAVADVSCPGRVVATLEGGYDVHALARCVESFLKPFLGA